MGGAGRRQPRAGARSRLQPCSEGNTWEGLEASQQRSSGGVDRGSCGWKLAMTWPREGAGNGIHTNQVYGRFKHVHLRY